MISKNVAELLEKIRAHQSAVKIQNCANVDNREKESRFKKAADDGVAVSVKFEKELAALLDVLRVALTREHTDSMSDDPVKTEPESELIGREG